MTGLTGARLESGRSWPGPETIAVLVAVVIYGVVLAVGLSSTSAGSPSISPAPTVGAGSSATAKIDPLRQDILGLLEIDARLTENREALVTLLKPVDIRASEVARVLREVSQTVRLGSERASRLAVDEASIEIGARLELVYAEADAAVEQALDSSIGNVAPYERAAETVVDLFLDLPEIDEQLQALLDRRSKPSPSLRPSPSASASPSPSPSVATPSATPSPVVPSISPIASGPVVVDLPGEMLQNRSFEAGSAHWQLLEAPAGSVTATSDAPLDAAGATSLRLDLAVPADPAAIVRIGQPVALSAGGRYVASVAVRATAQRPLRLRVVGPNQELHGVVTVEIGPTVQPVDLAFTALIDDPLAQLWIELPGAWSGSVWLDHASMTRTVDGP